MKVRAGGNLNYSWNTVLAPCYAKSGSYPVSIFFPFFATVRKGVQNLDNGGESQLIGSKKPG